jgi:hypothetical protein
MHLISDSVLIFVIWLAGFLLSSDFLKAKAIACHFLIGRWQYRHLLAAGWLPLLPWLLYQWRLNKQQSKPYNSNAAQ